MEQALSRAPRTSLPRRRLLALSLATLAALVAWGVLVWAAIDAGRQARSGAGASWMVMGVAAAGAALALFTMLLLCARLLSILQHRDQPPTRPPRIRGGRRAAR